MELAVINIEGKDTGRKVTLSDDLFSIEPNNHALYLDVKQYLANQRQGTHKSKERAEVSRTTKKFFRQKGTGNARVGSLKSPVQRGGGTVFGPRPRDYSFKLNKKLKGLARRSAISQAVTEDKIMVVENLSMDAPSTKNYLQILSALGIKDKKSLLVLGESNKSLYLSSRNFKGSKVVNASDINTYIVLNSQAIVLSEDSLEKLENVLRK
jgi:large subunit ribosomal protein L4